MLSRDAVIVKNPKILGGTPVFRGTRVPFQAPLVPACLKQLRSIKPGQLARVGN